MHNAVLGFQIRAGGVGGRAHRFSSFTVEKATPGPEFDAVAEVELVGVRLVDVHVGGNLIELPLEPVRQRGVSGLGAEHEDDHVLPC